MVTKPSKQTHIAALRQRAEEIADALTLEISNPQLEDYRHLLQELAVYQTEIEIQYDELQKSQVALADSRNAYAALYNLAPVGYFTINEVDLILEVNDTGIEMLGAELSAVVNQPLTQWIQKEAQDQYYLYKQAVHRDGKASCELGMVRDDDQHFDAQLESVQLDPNSDRPSGLRLALMDITERKLAQKHIRQQELLASVGQLTTGVAHDFNNILQIITTYAYLVQQDNLSEASKVNLEHIVQQSNRAADLVHQLLDFSRRSPSTKQPNLLFPILEETVAILGRVTPETVHIDLTINPKDSGCAVNIDVTQMQQVFINLALNAADAMPKGGNLDIHVSALQLQPNEEQPAPEMNPGNWVMVTVSDTGTGIATEHIDSIFEPFFTTKAIGKGSGLGLAQVHGIIVDHGGVILVNSPASGGTRFTIYFPETEQSISTPTDELDLPLPQVERGTILLVEDDPIVLAAIQGGVEHLGYATLTATNGEEGLAQLKQNRTSIRLVVTDVTMPGMDGLTMAEAIYRRDKTLPVIALSGYPLKEKTIAMSSASIIEWLPKPIDLDHLARALAKHIKPTIDPN